MFELQMRNLARLPALFATLLCVVAFNSVASAQTSQTVIGDKSIKLAQAQQITDRETRFKRAREQRRKRRAARQAERDRKRATRRRAKTNDAERRSRTRRSGVVREDRRRNDVRRRSRPRRVETRPVSEPKTSRDRSAERRRRARRSGEVTNWRDQRRIRGSRKNRRDRRDLTIRDNGRTTIIGAPRVRDRKARVPNEWRRTERRRYRADRRRWRGNRRASWINERRRRREILSRSDTMWVHRRRIRDLRGRLRYARSRRYWVREDRYRNRFRRGRSIYWLPPVGVALAAGAYVVASSTASYDDYIDTFMAPPVRRFDRRYSVDEVVADPEIRSSVRSVHVDIVTFRSGSDVIPRSQVRRLEELADAMLATLAKRPNEVFLIAGHTDAVGSDDSNLELSERRAAAVHEALVSEFGVPAKNLESVGYGEQYLRIETDGSDQRNRRVVVRAIGALVADRRR